jgi:uncharacterized membrane protein
VTVSTSGGFSSPVGLAATGLPTGASATFSPLASGTSTMTVLTSTSTPAGTYPLTITGTSGTLTHSASVSLTVNAQSGGSGDFSISVAPASARISRSGTTSYTVTITRTNFTSSVSLSATGFPSGMRGSFSPSSTTGTSSVFTVRASVLTMHTSWKLQITGSGGGKTHTTTLTLSTF